MGKQQTTSKHVKTTDLKIGQFADINGSVIYRYAPTTIGTGHWMPGIWFIETHNHLPIYDAPTVVNEDGQYTYMVVPYDTPDKKHVDHAINLLKKAMKDKQLNGLLYLDNLTTLKNYIEEDEYEVDNLLLNMSAGLEPKDLTDRDKTLLKRRYGKDWLFKLGYQSNLEYLESKQKRMKFKPICKCGHVKKDHQYPAETKWKDTYCRECGIDRSDLNVNLEPNCPRFIIDNLLSLENASANE